MGKNGTTTEKRGTPEPTQGTMQEFLNKAEEEQNLAQAEEAKVSGTEVKEFQMVDVTLMSEVINGMSALYEPSVVYNIPRRSNSGKISWPACKRMPGEYCKYQQDKEKHTHTVGISIHGARIAAQAYGNLEYGPLEMPTVLEMNGKLYWVVEVQCKDLIRGLVVNQWQFEPVLVTWGKTVSELEHGAAIVQAKGLRKVILSVVPPQLGRIWITDFLAGADTFDPQRIAELNGGRQGVGSGRNGQALPPGKDITPEKPPKKEPPKQENPNTGTKKPGSAGGMDLSKAADQLKDVFKVEKAELIEFAESSSFTNSAQATLQFVRSLTSDPDRDKLKVAFTKWQAEKKAEAEAEKDGDNEKDGAES